MSFFCDSVAYVQFSASNSISGGASLRLYGNTASTTLLGYFNLQATTGGGSLGSLSLSFEQRRPMTQNALENLTVADPDQIVTGCPLCLATFVREADRPVHDIAEILDEHC